MIANTSIIAIVNHLHLFQNVLVRIIIIRIVVPVGNISHPHDFLGTNGYRIVQATLVSNTPINLILSTRLD
jgi:hypothetical protein